MSLAYNSLGKIMKAREGDLIEAIDGNIFDVKGFIHPPGKVIAFIRFTPDSNGERKRGETRYRKVYALRERYDLLKKRFPQYLVFDPVFNQWLCEVPVEAVKQHYEPSTHLRQLRRKDSCDKLEKQALELAELLHTESRVNWNSLGVSGSLLVGLHTPKSDLDLIVYGSKSCWKVYNTLTSLVRDLEGDVRSYGEQDLKELFAFRSKDTIMKFEDFVRTESRKLLQGKFHEKDYFVRCIKAWNEVPEKYGVVQYRPVGEAKLRATVIDDSEMIFTPCTYPIEDTRILQGNSTESPQEIVSFRGRFCEQARKGEKIVARGMIESVKTGDTERFRLIIGNKPSDYMILAK
jgi:predicted nucleotidyltransferase